MLRRYKVTFVPYKYILKQKCTKSYTVYANDMDDATCKAWKKLDIDDRQNLFEEPEIQVRDITKRGIK